MFCYKKENTEIFINLNEGFVESLKYEGKEYIGAKVPLFLVALRNECGSEERINTFDMRLCEYTQRKNGFDAVYSDDIFNVTVRFEISDFLSWEIEISAIEDKAIEWVNYPQIAVPDDFADNNGSSKILWGYNEGTLIEDITAREIGGKYFEPQYPCQGSMGVYPAIVETQFMAYYNEHSGMYFASHDREDYLKGINFLRENGGVKLEFRHFGGGNVGEGKKLEYPMVIKFFRGDWYEAAEIYRNWFEENKKAEFIPIKENKRIPDWYGESPIIITYPVRGKHDTDVMTPNKLFPYINIMPHVERFEKAFGSKVMILLMHWEGTAPWAPPIVWPPYGGEEELKKLIDALHQRGDVVGVYCSGLGWTINSNVAQYNTEKLFEEQNLKEEMCLSPEQTLPYSKICTGQRSGYDLCPTREFTVNTVKDQVEKMVGAGIDYIQLMDQNHGGTSYFCYSKKHNHPYIPGKWQVDAVKNLLSQIQKNTGKTLFGCESAAAQSYIPYLLFSDNRFNLAYFIGKPVPMYSYVYHEYLNNFLGNQVCVDWNIDIDKSPESFFERIAYSFIAGDMLTVVITENGEIDWNWGKRDKEKAPPNQKFAETFIKNLNFWRKAKGKKYLHIGKMVKPFNVECETYQIHRRKYGVIEVPRIHTGAYLADDGSYGQFLVNYSAVQRECIVNIDKTDYVLQDYNSCLKLKQGENRITVKPFSAVMITGFWNHPGDSVIREYAKENNLMLAELGDLG